MMGTSDEKKPHYTHFGGCDPAYGAGKYASESAFVYLGRDSVVPRMVDRFKPSEGQTHWGRLLRTRAWADKVGAFACDDSGGHLLIAFLTVPLVRKNPSVFRGLTEARTAIGLGLSIRCRALEDTHDATIKSHYKLPKAWGGKKNKHTLLVSKAREFWPECPQSDDIAVAYLAALMVREKNL